MKWFHVLYDISIVFGSVVVYAFLVLFVLTIFMRKFKWGLFGLAFLLVAMTIFQYVMDLRILTYEWNVLDFRQTITPYLSDLLGDALFAWIEKPFIYFKIALIPLAILLFFVFGGYQSDAVNTSRWGGVGYIKQHGVRGRGRR